MPETSTLDPVLRQEIKRALAEALREERDVLREVFLEVVEDVGLREAIREGLAGDEVDRRAVFDLLDERG